MLRACDVLSIGRLGSSVRSPVGSAVIEVIQSAESAGAGLTSVVIIIVHILLQFIKLGDKSLKKAGG